MTPCFFTLSGFGQLTPGPLHRSHQSLEGLRNCTQCHAIGSKDFRQNCLDCHTVMKERIEQGKGLHAAEGFKRCQSCHSEHHGRDFDLVHWKDGKANFDHDLTGYPLVEKHRSPTCEACHKPANINAPEILTRAGKDLQRTFFGLSQNCVSCHEDPHQAQLGEDCLSCHVMTGWQPPSNFDHNRAAFTLVGAHVNLDCESCHTRQSQQTPAIMRFKPLNFAQCSDCHADPHAGTLSEDCLACHNQERWVPAPKFDHSQTAYPLTGRHTQVACDSCHLAKTSESPIQPSRIFSDVVFGSCNDCHRDAHDGRLGNDCQSCHQTNSWQAVSNQSFSHSRTRFPLKGLHQNLPCESCHLPGKPLAIAKFNQCSDCHQDYHQGQFRDRDVYQDCLPCHSEAGFQPAQFTLENHQRTSFTLDGAHLAQPCIACHVVEGPPRFNPPTTVFDLKGERCSDCHANPHGERLLAVSGETGCETCHNVATWTNIGFDHQQTGFALRAGHGQLDCRACHSQSENAGFYLTEIKATCSACHEDIHRGQFKQDSGVTMCEACHSNGTWRADLFDHDRDARFPLSGAHAKADCASCHPRENMGSHAFIRFKPLKTACEDCHTAARRGGGF